MPGSTDSTTTVFTGVYRESVGGAPAVPCADSGCGGPVAAWLAANATRPDRALRSEEAEARLPPATAALLEHSVRPTPARHPFAALQRMETNQACAIIASVICRCQLCQ